MSESPEVPEVTADWSQDEDGSENNEKEDSGCTSATQVKRACASLENIEVAVLGLNKKLEEIIFSIKSIKIDCAQAFRPVKAKMPNIQASTLAPNKTGLECN